MKNLTLSYFRKDLKLDIQPPVSYSVWNFIKHNYILDYDVFLPSKNKNLQRPFVWTIQQKRELILSIFKGIKLQPISVIMSIDDSESFSPSIDKRVWKIIDGKQRLSTILGFVTNKFSLLIDYKEYFYRDLPEELQGYLDRYSINVQIVYEYFSDSMISDDDKIAWFELINFAGTQQEIDHLNNLKS